MCCEIMSFQKYEAAILGDFLKKATLAIIFSIYGNGL